MSSAPTIAVALLPKVACPACWPAYAGLLGAVGLEGLLDERYLLPLTVGFVSLAVALATRRALQRAAVLRMAFVVPDTEAAPSTTSFVWRPVALTAIAGLAIVAGKFSVNSDLLLFGGVAGFITASYWGRRACTQPSKSEQLGLRAAGVSSSQRATPSKAAD